MDQESFWTLGVPLLNQLQILLYGFIFAHQDPQPDDCTVVENTSKITLEDKE